MMPVGSASAAGIGDPLVTASTTSSNQPCEQFSNRLVGFGRPFYTIHPSMRGKPRSIHLGRGFFKQGTRAPTERIPRIGWLRS